MADNQLSAKAQARLGLPEDFKVYSPFPFGGMNQQDTPIAIPDNEFVWIENFVRLGNGNFRTVGDVGSPTPTMSNPVYFAFFTRNQQHYCFVASTSGNATVLHLETLTTQSLTPQYPMYLASSGNLPYAKQWGTQYLLICNNNTANDFWVWDGALLYGAGTVAPNGVNILSGGFRYSTTPTLTVYGGSGSGLVLVPIVSGGSIVEVQIASPGSGYLPGDILQVAASGGGSTTTPILTALLSAGPVGGIAVIAGGSGYTSAPNVVFTGGGGSGATATATIANGAVVLITVTASGSGFTKAPKISFTGGGGGSGAVAVASLFPTGVASVVVNNGGTGFTSVPLINFIGGGGAGATGVAVLTPTSVASIELVAGGSGFTSVPTVTIVGGGYNGGTVTAATATAVLSGQSIASITLTGAGSGYTSPAQVQITGGGGAGAGAIVLFATTSIASVDISSIGQFYTDAPAVQVSAGANTSAYMTVSLMPYGVSGAAMETYLSRIWLVYPARGLYEALPTNGNWLASAPGGFIDFATSDGGIQATNADSFLQTRYTNVHQSSGYLYFFGDGSTSVLSNVSTSQAQGSSSVSTTYNYQTVDPQTGTLWRDTLQDFGRSSIIMNSTGVYGLYGGTISKISAKLDQLFTNAIYPPTAGAITPSSAVATLYNVKHYMVLMTVQDPDTKLYRNVMVTWNEKDWTVLTQSVNFIALATQKVGSSFNAYGIDAAGNIYSLFSAPSSTLAKRFDTKQYGADKMHIQKQAYATYLQVQDSSTGLSGVSGELTISASGVSIQNPEYPSMASLTTSEAFNVQPLYQAPPPYWSLWGTSMGGIYFVTASVKFNTSSPDVTVGNLTFAYADKEGFFGQ